MPETKRHLITAALPYGNGPIHIGHIAGAYLPADIYVRYLRLRNKDVAFICGMDEDGIPITLKARKEGITAQEVVDKFYGIQKQSFEDFGISFDIFHRTTDPLHHKTASDFFLKLHEKGKFIEEESEQFYDEEAGAFLADRYIYGTCPNCSYDHAYGDQCEKCGTSLSPSELINPKSTLSESTPILRKTKHWYLPLNEYEGWLKKWILEEHSDWKPNVYGQCKSWLNEGLKPRAMSRDLDWGVKVPLKEADGKVLYVWFDAPIGYISATKALMEDHEKYSPDDWKLFWQDEESELIHFIGKDNIVFHCIIFPSMLKAHGDFILPKNVPANEFLNLEGQKLSTSRNWAVWLHEYLEDFPEQQDSLRYTLCANAPETKDNEFTWKDFQQKTNNELVAVLGNMVNRVIVLTHKYFDGKVPVVNNLDETGREILNEIQALPDQVADHIEQFKFREALNTAMRGARLANKYLTETEPWKLIKTDEQATRNVLNVCLQVCAFVSITLEPFLPFAAKKLQAALNISSLSWKDLKSSNLLLEGHTINKAEHLFRKIEDSEIENQRNKLGSQKETEANKKPEMQKATIEFDDFQKLDLCVAKITAAEAVPKTDKLLKINLSLGNEQRIVVSGIAQYYKPEEIVGKKVLYLQNLKPIKLRGVVSEGMILMAENEKGELSMMSPVKDLEEGSRVR